MRGPGHWEKRVWVFDNPKDSPFYKVHKKYSKKDLNPDFDSKATFMGMDLSNTETKGRWKRWIQGSK
jgi:hypothetical protein